jgi:hypothetical protein
MKSWLQVPNAKRPDALGKLRVGTWNFFGTWNLKFGTFDYEPAD